MLDASTGAHYDSIGDGWFFAGPSQPPPNGVGDMGNQALAVGFITGVLELRAIAEFPLGLFEGFDPNDIVVSATLTVTIDDVIGSFGPGATFDGTASDTIAVQAFPADGTVTLADFFPDDRAEIDEIELASPITDATLAMSGAVAFELDVTALMRTAVANGFEAFGVIMATNDSPTAMSCDNLGVSGAAFPFITIEVDGAAPTTTLAGTDIHLTATLR